MMRRVSIFWIILIALLFTSAVPLGIMAWRSISTTSAEVEREQKQQLQNRVADLASGIDEQFRQFEITTHLAATRARELMVDSAPLLTEDDLDSGLVNYQRDQFDVYGLDAYYLEQDGRVPSPEQYNISNVYVNRTTDLDPDLARIILATEGLDDTFASIREEDFGSQWVYLTTPEMMRLYPWHPNQYGPPEVWPVWKPWTILFYTAAADQGILILQQTVETVPADEANEDLPACTAETIGRVSCAVDCDSTTLDDSFCAAAAEDVVIEYTISTVDRVTSDTAKAFFRAPDLSACSAASIEAAMDEAEAAIAAAEDYEPVTCYAACETSPLAGDYCQGSADGIAVVEISIATPIVSSGPQTSIPDGVRLCTEGGVGVEGETCYVDCSDTSSLLYQEYCAVDVVFSDGAEFQLSADVYLIEPADRPATTEASNSPLPDDYPACDDIHSEDLDACRITCPDEGETNNCTVQENDEINVYHLSGIVVVSPEPEAADTAVVVAGIAQNDYPECSDTVTGTACYLDCDADYTDPLHQAHCRGTTWTAPYYDFAGQGLMVTNAFPIYNADEVIGVMSHDLRIDVMEAQVLGFEVGEEGFAFLLDRDGQIIAHRDYSPEQFAKDARQGEAQFQVLANEEPDIASIVERMTAGESGVASYEDNDGEDWIVAYTTVESTGWHMGLAQPRSEIIAPATKIRTEVLTGAGTMILVVLLASVWLARRITKPVLQLSETAKEVRASVDTEMTDVIGQNLKELSNLSSAREITNLADVFKKMVTALQDRMVELNSIYAMGQTITANVDYEDTMQAVLKAVREVVAYDAAEISLMKGKSLTVEAWQGSEGYNDTTGRKYKVGRGPTGQIADTKQSVLLSEIKGTEDLQRTLGYAGAGSEFLAKTTKVVINSFLGIPLLIGDRLLGTLALVHQEKGHFSDDDERQLSKLAAQASVAIQNAMQVREREGQLKRQIEELKIEIDQAKLTKQVEEVTDSDFFRNLQQNAARMRRRFSEDDTDSDAAAEGPASDSDSDEEA